MVSTAQILSKRKRVSKKNKKSWRKHTDIKDVEKFLEEKLREERTGGNPSEKQSSELFYIDKSDLFQTPKSKLDSMKCHSDLQIDTKVAPVTGYSGPRKKKKKTMPPTLSNSSDCKMTDTKLSCTSDVCAPGVSYDIWGTQPTKTKILDPCLPPPVLPPQKYKSSDTSLPAVEIPHPGASYNPTFTDHQELLQSALNVEVKREKAKTKATRDAAPPITISEEDYIKEMSAGLNDDPSEDVSTAGDVLSQVGDTADNIAPSVAPDRKTKSQRNKEKAERVKVEDIAAAKEAKRLAHQLNRVKAIKKEIKTEEAQTNAKEADRTAKRTEKQLRPGKYGPGKLMEEQPEFLLPEEVSSSLRQLVNSTNTVKDRFTSLQKRNLIEIRRKVAPHRKYKLKTVEKWRKKLPEELDELVRMKGKKKKIKISE